MGWMRRVACHGAMALALLAALANGAAAQEKLRVGKAVPHAYGFAPLNVGIETGLFRKYGVDVEQVDFTGSAKLHAGMVAGAIDIGLGSGPELALVAKGSPEIGVAALAGKPLLLGILVPWDSPAHQASDLKGAKIGVSSTASLTYWLALELARTQGWGPGGVIPVSTGGDMAAEIAALRTHQVDAQIDAVAMGFQLEEQKQGRVLIPVSDYVHDFITHVIFASNRLVEKNPAALRNFLKGWFATIAFMRADKAATIEIVRQVTGFTPAIEEREYDLVTPMFSADGRFEPVALATVGRSFVPLGLLDHEPDITKLVTEAYLPGAN